MCEVFLLCANRTVSMQLVMNVLRWIVLSHCVYRVSNYCLSVYLDIAGLTTKSGTVHYSDKRCSDTRYSDKW